MNKSKRELLQHIRPSPYKPKELGHFRTPEMVIKEILDSIPESVWERGGKFFDPACGYGTFLLAIAERLKPFHPPTEIAKMIYGLDIDSTSVKFSKKGLSNYLKVDSDCLNIMHGDFLTWETDLEFDIVICNPPYGKNSNLAVTFLNKSGKLAPNVYMILPKTIRKESYINRIYSKMHVDFDVDNSKVSCIQHWVTKDELREKVVRYNKHPDFSFVKPDKADIMLGRIGEGPSGIVKTEDFSHRYGGHYFLKVKDNNVIDRLMSLENEFRTAAAQTVANPSLSKHDLIRAYIEKYG